MAWPSLDTLVSLLTTLQYPLPTPPHPDSFPEYSYYGTGLGDGWILISMIAAMAILRDVLRLGVFEPYARWSLLRQLRERKERELSKSNGNGVAATNGKALNGHGDAKTRLKPRKSELRAINRSVLRFAEQGYQFTYYTSCWCSGLWIHHNLPTQILNPEGTLWINYPHMPLALPIKLYYLVQFSFYLHQLFVLHAEARRKDHYQMLYHHFITIGLLLMSYIYGYTRVGCVVLVLMDTVDVFFPFAKMLKYLNYTTACDVAFGAFLVSWFITRHMLFPLIIWSTYKDMLRYMPYGWDPENNYYVTWGIWVGYLVLMSTLEVVQLVWFKAICAVAYRVITGQGAEDTRSDGEDDDEDNDEDDKTS